MTKATITDRTHIVGLLTKAFINNKSVNFIVREGNGKNRHIKALMEYSFDMCMELGAVFLDDNGTSAALILYPHHKKTSFYTIWLDMLLIWKAIGISRVGRAIKRENRIKSVQPTQPIIYLWFIGVDPSFQHGGKGSVLLLKLLEFADTKQLPVFLETSAPENVKWYVKFGFVVYHELNLGYKLFFLKRPLPDK